MPRDKQADPRYEARQAMAASPRLNALVWGVLYVGDALHRLAKAVEASSGVEPERFRPESEFVG